MTAVNMNQFHMYTQRTFQMLTNAQTCRYIECCRRPLNDCQHNAQLSHSFTQRQHLHSHCSLIISFLSKAVRHNWILQHTTTHWNTSSTVV